MSSPMRRVSSLMSRDIENYLTNQATWGSIIANVKSYGAKGDMVTDDTAKIQEAINAVSAVGGGVVFFPEGIYLVSATLVLRASNVSFEGKGEILFTGPSFSPLFRISGTIGNSMNITSAISAGANSFFVSPASSTTISVGDYVRIISDENYFVISTRDHKKGEMIRVSAVNNSTGEITVTGRGIILGYSVSGFTPVARVISFIDNIKIDGIKMTGAGTYSRQIGVHMEYVRNSTVSGQAEITAFEAGIRLNDCVFADISNTFIHNCNRNETGYGITLEGVTQRVNVSNNKFENNRHSFTTGGYDGVVMYVNVSGNNVYGDLNAGLNTHGNARFVSFNGNTLDHCGLGISAYSPHTSVLDNIIVNSNSYPIYLVEGAFINATVRGNKVEYTVTGDVITVQNSGVTAFGVNDYIIIENNVINNCVNSSGIVTLGSTQAVVVSVRNNDINLIGYDGINVADGEKIIINGNNLHRSTRAGAAGNDGITAACTPGVGIYGSIMQITNNNIYNYNKGIKVTLATVLLVDGNVIHTGPGNQFDITGVTTQRIGANFPDVYAATLVWNPANLADGDGETSAAITVAGAALGDFVSVASPYDLQGITCSAYVSAVNTVRIRLQNESGVAVDLASGTWKVKVNK